MTTEKQKQILDLVQKEITIPATLAVNDGFVDVEFVGKIHHTQYHIDELVSLIENGTVTAKSVAKGISRITSSI